MFNVGKGSSQSNVPTDPWNLNGMNLRQVDKGLHINPTAAQKLATMPQQQAQFSPVQFGGASPNEPLAQLVEKLLKGTGGR